MPNYATFLPSLFSCVTSDIISVVVDACGAVPLPDSSNFNSSLAIFHSDLTCRNNKKISGSNASGTAQFIQSGMPREGFSPFKICTTPWALVPRKVHTIANGKPDKKQAAIIFDKEMSIAPRAKFLTYKGKETLRKKNNEVNPPRKIICWAIRQFSYFSIIFLCAQFFKMKRAKSTWLKFPKFLPMIATGNPIRKPNKKPGKISNGVQGRQKVTPAPKKMVYPMMPCVPAFCTHLMNVSAFLRKNEVWGGVEDGGAEDDKEGEEEKEEEEEEEEEDDDDASSRFDSADGVEVASIAMTAVTMIIIETKRAVISFRFSF